MEIITKDDFWNTTQKYVQMIQEGAIFVYPTDTVYGIGCDAQNTSSVATINKLKHRPKTQQFSIIAPSKQWMYDHCVLSKKAEEWIAKLPGPYTLILPTKEGATVGVRIPNHWIQEVVQQLGLCIVTTSVNKSGSQPITKISDIPSAMAKKIAFCIDEGQLQGNPSMLVYLNQGEVQVKQR